MSIDELKTQHTNLVAQLNIAVSPLRERLKNIGLTIFWEGNQFVVTNKDYRFYAYPLPLDDEICNKLLSMTDDELEAEIYEY